MIWKRIKIFLLDTKWYFLIAVALVSLIVWAYQAVDKLLPNARNYLGSLLPFQLIMGVVNAAVFVLLYWTVLNGGFSRLSNSRLRVKSTETNIHFSDVIGLENAKQEAKEIVELIRDRTRIKKMGGSIIRGLLMIGPPGCGKTMLAKAIATECQIPFLSISGSEFVEVFVGVGASRVRNLFRKARRLADVYGSCIIFIDELDVIGRGRVFTASGGGEETNSTQNQLLAEMDGLKSRSSNILMIGATNAMESVLDKALLRPGRFDRHLFVHPPHYEERKALFNYLLAKTEHDPSIDTEILAKRTIAKSGADIDNIVKEAVLIAARSKRTIICHSDIADAMERIELGSKSGLRLIESERHQVACHESGHLVANFLLHPTHGVFKASIIPRKNLLGYVQHHPEEERYMESRDMLLADIKVNLAGSVAEKLKMGQAGSGTMDDLKKATQQAHRMCWRMGMGKSKLIGDYTTIPQEQISDEFRNKLNKDTETILSDCMAEVEVCLKKNLPVLDQFISELMAKDELHYDEIERIFEFHNIKKSSQS